MIYQLRHTTHYAYSAPVTLCHNEARLLPRQLDWQRCEPSSVTISPNPAVRMERVDFFGNRVLYFAIQDIHRELEVTVETRLETLPRQMPTAVLTHWEACRDQLQQASGAEVIAAKAFTLDSPFVRRHAGLAGYAAESFTPGRPLVDCVQDLNRRIFADFVYDPSFTTLATPLADVLAQRRGVCQDFAHLAIGCLRSQGLAARYVSGYLETQPPPGKPRLIGADASHAWCSAFIPGWGWLDIDPTNGNLPGERHLVTGWGRDYADVAPLKGVMNGGGEHTLKVEVDVLPMEETPQRPLTFTSEASARP